MTFFIQWERPRYKGPAESIVTCYDSTVPQDKCRTESGLKSRATFHGKAAGYQYRGRKATRDDWFQSQDAKEARRLRPLGRIKK